MIRLRCKAITTVADNVCFSEAACGLGYEILKGAGAIPIRTLKKQPEVMHDWNDTVWTVMVEKAIVHKDGQITFVFQNGTEIKVGA